MIEGAFGLLPWDGCMWRRDESVENL